MGPDMVVKCPSTSYPTSPRNLSRIGVIAHFDLFLSEGVWVADAINFLWRSRLVKVPGGHSNGAKTQIEKYKGGRNWRDWGNAVMVRWVYKIAIAYHLACVMAILRLISQYGRTGAPSALDDELEDGVGRADRFREGHEALRIGIWLSCWSDPYHVNHLLPCVDS